MLTLARIGHPPAGALGFLSLVMNREELGRAESLEGLIGFMIVILAVGGPALGAGVLMWTRAVDRAVAGWAAQDRPTRVFPVEDGEHGAPPIYLLPPPDGGPASGPDG